MGETLSIVVYVAPELYPAFVSHVLRLMMEAGFRPMPAAKTLVPFTVAEGKDIMVAAREELLKPGGWVVSLYQSDFEYVDLDTTEPFGGIAITTAGWGPGESGGKVWPVFARLDFPEDATVLGETQHRWERLPDRSPNALVSPNRLVDFGFFWVDTLTTRQWDALLRESPGAFRGLVARCGDNHVVRLWDNPYDERGDLAEWRAIARTVALSGR